MNAIRYLVPREELLDLLGAHLGKLHVIRRDLYDAALDAPQNALCYGGEDGLFNLAALYADRLASAHALADGNKRLATMACLMFLDLNGVEISVSPEDLAEHVCALAGGRVDTESFAAFLKGQG